jgi:hypothetical protein
MRYSYTPTAGGRTAIGVPPDIRGGSMSGRVRNHFRRRAWPPTGSPARTAPPQSLATRTPWACGSPRSRALSSAAARRSPLAGSAVDAKAVSPRLWVPNTALTALACRFITYGQRA